MPLSVTPDRPFSSADRLVRASLLAAYLAVFTWGAIAPYYRPTWWVENAQPTRLATLAQRGSLAEFILSEAKDSGMTTWASVSSAPAALLCAPGVEISQSPARTRSAVSRPREVDCRQSRSPGSPSGAPPPFRGCAAECR